MLCLGLFGILARSLVVLVKYLLNKRKNKPTTVAYDKAIDGSEAKVTINPILNPKYENEGNSKYENIALVPITPRKTTPTIENQITIQDLNEISSSSSNSNTGKEIRQNIKKSSLENSSSSINTMTFVKRKY